MGIKPALGWLALLLFTTTAQAEGTRELIHESPRLGPPLLVPVIAKTKAPAPSAARPGPGSLVVLDSEKPQRDYEAEVYSGVPLDGDLAKRRGLDKGLVLMVFERERRGTFRVAKDRIRRMVRLGAEDTMALAKASTQARRQERWDVLDTDDGVVVVATTTSSMGMFTTSDVFVFPRGATLERRISAVETLPATARGRVRDALVLADAKRR
jgi:hypothetical protein